MIQPSLGYEFVKIEPHTFVMPYPALQHRLLAGLKLYVVTTEEPYHSRERSPFKTIGDVFIRRECM